MKKFRFGWIGLLVGLWLGWGQRDAFAQKVYWTDVHNHKIQRANVACLLGPNPSACIETVLDTLSVVPPTYDGNGNLTHPGAKSPNSVNVDVSGGRIYWSDFWTGVHRTTMDGSSTQTLVSTPAMAIHSSWNPPVCMPDYDGSGNPICRDDPRYPWESTRLLRTDIQGVALDLAHQLLYFGPDHPFESPLGSKYLNPYPNSYVGGRIRRSNLDGSQRVDLLSNAVDGFPGSLGLDLSRNKMYWGSPTSGYYPHPNRLMRANLDGTNMETFLLLDGSNGPWLDPRDIAVDEAAGQVYFTTAYVNSIWRVKVDGTGLTQLRCCLDTPQNIVLDLAGGKMYFAEVYRSDGSGGAVSRANLDGSGYERLVTASLFPAGTFPPDLPFAPNGIDLANQPPIASAGANPTSGIAPLTVNFSSVGSSDPDGTIATYAWTFGDGGTSSQLNPSHSYSSGGVYTATLVVTDRGGLTDSDTVTITVNTNQPPVANAGATPTSGSAPLSVTFSSTGSSDPENGTLTFSWNFGDGGSSTSPNPTHSYSSGGVYTATLVVTDNGGLTGSDTVNITVNVPNNQPPVANSGATPTSGFAPLTVNFSSAGSSDPENGTLTYSWNFGDGGSSTSPNPSHTFNSPGTYTTVLTVTDNQGAQATSSVGISAQQDPNARPDQVISSVSTSASSAPAGGSVTVTDTTKNQGAAQAAASSTFIYFSLDVTLDAGDAKIGSRAVDVLNAGSTSSNSTPVTIPANATPGTTAYLIVVADGANTVAESNEGNNTWATPISIGGPDLIVSALSAPSRKNDGDNITISDTTKNQGTAPAGASATNYYWSKDNIYQVSDTLIGSRTVGGLLVGASNSGSLTWRIPRGTSKGTYHIIARADAGGGVTETNETNNVRSISIDVK